MSDLRQGLSPAVQEVLDRLSARKPTEDDRRDIDQLAYDAEEAITLAVDRDEIINAAVLQLALLESMDRRGVKAVTL